jgi:hypothetical protein
MPRAHMLFYSGEIHFMIYDVINDVANCVLNIIRIFMKFVPDYQEHLRMQSSFE